jgi:putative ABC transport system ATP-binding protein
MSYEGMGRSALITELLRRDDTEARVREFVEAFAVEPEHTAALDPKSADQVIRLTHEIIQRDKLTTLMVTHSMQQAVHLGDRIVMMHRGEVLHDLQGAERARARPEDLLKRFDEVRRREQLDPTVAEMLQRNYV